MKPFVVSVVLALMHASSLAAAAGSAQGAPALGTSAAVDAKDRLWIAYVDQEHGGAIVKVARYDDEAGEWLPALRVNRALEPVSADGENRPKLAFGPAGEIYVTWTSPTSAQYTGDIRFARSVDGGKTWSDPATVHRDRQRIAHRFESLIVDAQGRLWVAWVDKRDLHEAEAAHREYAGAAIYYAYSDDRGTSWQGDFKLADHTCECCRIALEKDAQGRASAMWRHVFPSNERDHAVAVLAPAGTAPRITRATFEGWRIDACPHHGPGLALGADGVRHAVWFNQLDGQGRVFYGQLNEGPPAHVRPLPMGAAHADIRELNGTLAIAWKRFDGSATRIETWLSTDAGRTFSVGPSLQTATDSDQPRLVSTANDIFLVWRRADGTAVQQLTSQPARPPEASSQSTRKPLEADPAEGPLPFGPDTLARVEERLRGQSFWLIIWDLECTYCMKSLANIAEAQKRRPSLRVVTVTTDSLALAREINVRLAQIELRTESYAFAESPQEALRYAIDTTWSGEKPRAYRYSPGGERVAISGVLSVQQVLDQ